MSATAPSWVPLYLAERSVNPCILALSFSASVSKEHATIVLGELLARNNPAEAHKLIDPLRTSLRGAISRTAITDSANLPPLNPPAAPPAAKK